MSVYHVGTVPMEAREGNRVPRTRVKDGFE